MLPRHNLHPKTKRPVIASFLLLTVVAILTFQKITPAFAVCEKPALAKTWVNPEAELHELTKLKFTYNCGEKPIRHYDPLSASLWLVRAYSKCGRTDCAWGRTKGVQLNSHMTATFNTYAAVRKLKIRTESGLLKVDVEIKYRDENRKPVVYQIYMHPEQ